jgi:hypothetical protein
LFEHLPDLLLWQRALEEGKRLSGHDGEQRGDSLHAEGLPNARLLVDINLGQEPPAIGLGDQLFQDGAELLTGLTPGCPEINDHGHHMRAFGNVNRKRFLGGSKDKWNLYTGFAILFYVLLCLGLRFTGCRERSKVDHATGIKTARLITHVQLPILKKLGRRNFDDQGITLTAATA